MSQRTLLAILLLMALAACGEQAGDPTKPDAYAERLNLQPARGGTLQRIALPPVALAALRRPDFGDVRIFDAHDRVVPVALIPAEAAARRSTVSVPVYPILDSAGAPEQAALSVRIDDAGGTRVVTVDAPAGGGGATRSDAVLLDTRALNPPAVAIELVTEIPPDRPVTLTLWQSVNLRDWAPLAETTLFRAATEAIPLGGARIALPGVDLRGRYVKISWRGTAGVAVTSAKVVLSAAAPTRRIAVATTPLTLADAHELLFDLPTLASLSGMRIALRGKEGIVPVQLYGRHAAEQPWTRIATATLRAGSAGSVLDIQNQQLPQYRLVADNRTAGFTVAPQIDLLLNPVQLLASFEGEPPYRLAVGLAAAHPIYLASNEIAPDTRLIGLPQSTIVSAPAVRPVVATARRPGDDALEPRKLALWGILLLATAVLALAVTRLIRQRAAS